MCFCVTSVNWSLRLYSLDVLLVFLEKSDVFFWSWDLCDLGDFLLISLVSSESCLLLTKISLELVVFSNKGNLLINAEYF